MSEETEFLKDERQGILKWLFDFIFGQREGAHTEAREKVDRLMTLERLLGRE